MTRGHFGGHVPPGSGTVYCLPLRRHLGYFYVPTREFYRWCGLHKLPSLKRGFHLCSICSSF